MEREIGHSFSLIAAKTSKNCVFDRFLPFLPPLETFQSIVHYAKRLDVVGEKVRAICTAELLKVPADCQFSAPSQNALQTPSNKYTNINHFTITKRAASTSVFGQSKFTDIDLFCSCTA